jgi:hypothetical protein
MEFHGDPLKFYGYYIVHWIPLNFDRIWRKDFYSMGFLGLLIIQIFLFFFEKKNMFLKYNFS